MPDSNSNSIGIGQLTYNFPIASYTATYQINSGTAIAAGASVTETITFTGIVTTDNQVAIRARDAIQSIIPKGLQLVSTSVTATNTLTVVWKNTTTASITPPASATWTAVVFGVFSK